MGERPSRLPRFDVRTTEPAFVPDAADHNLDIRYISYQRAVGLIATAAIGALSLTALIVFWVVGHRFSSGAFAATVVLWAVALAALWRLLHIWPEIEHRHSSYRVDEHGIAVRRGVYWRVVIHVPRSRVQHTDVSQGPLERRYGLGTLAIYTAGTDHAKVTVPGLDYRTAVQIRDHLLPREEDDVV